MKPTHLKYLNLAAIVIATVALLGSFQACGKKESEDSPFIGGSAGPSVPGPSIPGSGGTAPDLGIVSDDNTCVNIGRDQVFYFATRNEGTFYASNYYRGTGYVSNTFDDNANFNRFIRDDQLNLQAMDVWIDNIHTDSSHQAHMSGRMKLTTQGFNAARRYTSDEHICVYKIEFGIGTTGAGIGGNQIGPNIYIHTEGTRNSFYAPVRYNGLAL